MLTFRSPLAVSFVRRVNCACTVGQNGLKLPSGKALSAIVECPNAPFTDPVDEARQLNFDLSSSSSKIRSLIFSIMFISSISHELPSAVSWQGPQTARMVQFRQEQ